MFIDIAHIYVKAGDGGPGSVSFRREKFVPKGGPDGGDGGKGGDIVFISDHNLRSLMDFNYKNKYKAQDGVPGDRRNMFGKDGENMEIRVPVGTLLKDKLTEEIIHDFQVDNEIFILAHGGKGGKGNSHFATSVNQTPYYAQKGLAGEERDVIMELKLIADVGIIGYPNVGKSSIISKITNSRPKIADYPFTTLVPNLGVVKYKDDKQFVIADVPGLIENAHTGQGLGHQFLRHVERTTLLVHVLDVADFYDRDVVKDYKVINQELVLFNPDILKKEQIVVFNKIDAVEDRSRLEKLKKKFKNHSVYMISAATGEGIDALLAEITKKVSEKNDI